ncbi:MAG: alpha/beta hydrolase [Deltaproteobacteria bacterium]|nr:alpha/beta hydrolase [Deltaproteobacteria bacterium]
MHLDGDESDANNYVNEQYTQEGGRPMSEFKEIGPSGLAVRQSGGSAGPVLLCHGNSLAAELYDKQLRSSLGENTCLFALDLPGHGNSPDDPEQYTPASLVNSIVEVVDALALDQPILVGHSLGGHLMTQVAARIGPIRGLFVFSTPLLTSLAAMPEAFLPNPAIDLLFKAELCDDEVATLTSLFAPGGGEDAERVERALRRADPLFRSTLAAALRGEYPDEVALARGLKAPVAIVHGANDPLVSYAYLKQLNLPNMWREEVQIIDDAGHLPHLDSAERFNALLGAFVEDVS